MFKFTLILGLVLSFQWVQAQTHIRLWRGFKQDANTAAEFKESVASKLVPETIVVGKNKGLVSYMPVFLTADERKPEFVPDEVAIIQYKDDKTYKALASTPEFSAYGKMHYEKGFFAKKNNAGFGSGSLVSQALSEDISFDLKKVAAVHYGNVDRTWKKDPVQLSVILLKESKADKADCLQSVIENLKTLVQEKSLKGFVLAYDPSYILVYTKDLKTEKQISHSCSEERVIQLKNQTGFDEQTEGVNVSF